LSTFRPGRALPPLVHAELLAEGTRLFDTEFSVNNEQRLQSVGGNILENTKTHVPHTFEKLLDYAIKEIRRF
jgi:hypothetical protein